jgi:ribosomal protein S18 acetylase RimI-like enzyme
MEKIKINANNEKDIELITDFLKENSSEISSCCVRSLCLMCEECLFYKKNGVIVGVVMYDLNSHYMAGYNCYISYLLVAEKERRKGYGKYIVGDIMNVEKVDLILHVRKDNQSAVSMYKSCGFEIESKKDEKCMDDETHSTYLMKLKF